jgi:oxaloacetate decarboxylase beta subunit
MSVQEVLDMLYGIFYTTGISQLGWQYGIMWGIAGLFLYLAIAKDFEPLLLLPIGFGIFIVNFPLVPLMGYSQGHAELLRVFCNYGLEWEVIPCEIFLGLGAMNDFGPLIANPKTLLIGAGAQFGVFVTFKTRESWSWIIGTLFIRFTGVFVVLLVLYRAMSTATSLISLSIRGGRKASATCL